MKKVLWLVILIVLFTGCDRQRDLYIKGSPFLYIEGDWVPSLGISDMSQRATAMLYHQSDDNAIIKEFFSFPDHVTVQVAGGKYAILLFNGLMFTEDDTNLNHIYFRNTDRVETFEAFVEEATPNGRLVRADNEYLASNDMEILTAAYTEEYVEDTYGYVMKYQNGHDQFPNLEDLIENQIRMTPRPLSYYVQIVVHLVNPNSAAVSNGALRGFTGSVFMASGMPSHTRVTHQLRLNNLQIEPNSQPEMGTIESPVFVTFGPPVDLNESNNNWTYEFELSTILKDGTEMNKTFDIAPQVLPIIGHIKANTLENTRSHPILIEIWMELPVMESVINVGNWEDEEIIRIKIEKE